MVKKPYMPIAEKKTIFFSSWQFLHDLASRLTPALAPMISEDLGRNLSFLELPFLLGRHPTGTFFDVEVVRDFAPHSFRQMVGEGGAFTQQVL